MRADEEIMVIKMDVQHSTQAVVNITQLSHTLHSATPVYVHQWS